MGESIITRSGSSSTSSSGSSGVLKNEIILGNINWVVPEAKDQKFRVILFGGGGSGCRNYSGCGGFMNYGDLTLNKGDTISITIGDGGIPTNADAGNAGGTSFFGSYLSANGGSISSGGSGGGSPYRGQSGSQFGGGGGGLGGFQIRRGGDGGIWGGGGGGSGGNSYRGIGGTYGGNGGSNQSSVDGENGTEFNPNNSIILGDTNRGFGRGGKYRYHIGKGSMNGWGGGGGYGSRGGDGGSMGGGGGGGYGPTAIGGAHCGGGGGFYAKGGNGTSIYADRNSSFGGGGGGCGAFGLNGKGGDGMDVIFINNNAQYIQAEDGGIAAGGGAGYMWGDGSQTNNFAGAGGPGVCIIQYYI